MYLWHSKRLAADIKNGQLSEKDWKNYYLAGMVLIAIYLCTGTTDSGIGVANLFYIYFVELLMLLAVIFVGVNITFNTHQRGQDKTNYISKIIALSLPLQIKSWLVVFPAALLWLGIEQLVVASAETMQLAFEWYLIIMEFLIWSWIFWRLNVHLKSIAA